MTDIVERLRSENTLTGYYDPPQLQEEAASEIERLRAEIVLLEATGAEAADEIERLRATLRRALGLHDIEQAERPAPNVPAWVEDARALLTEGER